MEHKIKRCQNYAEIDEKLSLRELEKAIRKIDARRSQYNSLFPNMDWGDKKRYHLLINTTNLNIKRIVPHIAQYADCWFECRKEPGDA